MKNFYFTFGSWRGYPAECRNRYVLVSASSEESAVRLFRDRYPDRNPGCLNCAFYYNQKQWDDYVSRHHEGQPPALTITEERGIEACTA